ncbi:GGDEF domain-containing protein [Chrysiogenes arsenatis]|uniref:GGDEF domain-containing protein n=1 Tax=Chrysiogenes arsenatis TaxID=309797 RepID=UPI0003F88BB9|nr:GGDEF domain-containing protein [Chrysiogenes arsenatis]
MRIAVLYPADSVKHFFALIVVLGIVSIGMIAFFSAYGMQKTITNQIAVDAQDDATHVAQALLETYSDMILQQQVNDQTRVYIESDQAQEFDYTIRRFLFPFEIHKIKIFNQSGRVVYSTDSAIIGMLDSDNPRLQRALAGEVDASMKRKGSMVDLKGEQVFGIDVVETYVPIQTADGTVVGAFEIYKDVTRYAEAGKNLIAENVTLLGIVLILVFAPSMIVVRILTSRLASAQRQLKQQATIDGLTGVLVRNEVLTQARERLSLYGNGQHGTCSLASHSLILIDVDYFKKVNDTCGHQAGDFVLKEVCARIASVLRESDLFGRFGGEEFLVVLPETTLETARAIAERIRGIIEKNPFVWNDSELAITISLGVAALRNPSDREMQVALGKADQALYLAKGGGRNRVEVVDAL